MNSLKSPFSVPGRPLLANTRIVVTEDGAVHFDVCLQLLDPG